MDENARTVSRLVLNGVAAEPTLDLQPPLGSIYRVFAAYGYHDDVAAVDCQWVLIDSSVVISARAGLVTSAKLQLFTDYATGFPTLTSPIVISYGCQLQFQGTVAAGKKLYIRAIVEQISGLDT